MENASYFYTANKFQKIGLIGSTHQANVLHSLHVPNVIEVFMKEDLEIKDVINILEKARTLMPFDTLWIIFLDIEYFGSFHESNIDSNDGSKMLPMSFTIDEEFKSLDVNEILDKLGICLENVFTDINKLGSNSIVALPLPLETIRAWSMTHDRIQELFELHPFSCCIYDLEVLCTVRYFYGGLKEKILNLGFIKQTFEYPMTLYFNIMKNFVCLIEKDRVSEVFNVWHDAMHKVLSYWLKEPLPVYFPKPLSSVSLEELSKKSFNGENPLKELKVLCTIDNSPKENSDVPASLKMIRDYTENEDTYIEGFNSIFLPPWSPRPPSIDAFPPSPLYISPSPGYVPVSSFVNSPPFYSIDDSLQMYSSRISNNGNENHKDNPYSGPNQRNSKSRSHSIGNSRRYSLDSSCSQESNKYSDRHKDRSRERGRRSRSDRRTRSSSRTKRNDQLKKSKRRRSRSRSSSRRKRRSKSPFRERSSQNKSKSRKSKKSSSSSRSKGSKHRRCRSSSNSSSPSSSLSSPSHPSSKVIKEEKSSQESKSETPKEKEKISEFTLEDFNRLKAVIIEEVNDKYSSHLQKPEMHPQYQGSLRVFLHTYKEKFGKFLKGDDHKKECWNQYWKSKLETFKDYELKKRMSELEKKKGKLKSSSPAQKVPKESKSRKCPSPAKKDLKEANRSKLKSRSLVKKDLKDAKQSKLKSSFRAEKDLKTENRDNLKSRSPSPVEKLLKEAKKGKLKSPPPTKKRLKEIMTSKFKYKSPSPENFEENTADLELPSNNERLNVHIEEFSIVNTLNLLCQIKGKLGALGDAITALHEEYNKKKEDGQSALSVFQVSDAKIVLEMILDKLNRKMQSASEADKPLFERAHLWSKKLVEISERNMPNDCKPSEPLDLDKIAFLTYGKDPIHISNVVKAAMLHFEGNENPPDELVKHNVLKVLYIQANLKV